MSETVATASQVALQEGDEAPDFTMPASGGRTVSRAALLGRPFLLYFYPRADTPGCTTQACGLQEALPQLGGLGLEVIGVSRDPMPAIDRFAQKFSLTFPLASDQSGVAEAYGTWVQKSMYGKTYMGLERSSFLVGRDGRIARIWRKVKVARHAADVAEAARAL
jgi:peroxiredoxin Q/BCP